MERRNLEHVAGMNGTPIMVQRIQHMKGASERPRRSAAKGNGKGSRRGQFAETRPVNEAARPTRSDELVNGTRGATTEAAPAYQRLSAEDRLFLACEGPNSHMHVAATLVFDGAPLATPGGGVDIERIANYVASRLHAIPRYRQRLTHTPFEGHPVWIDHEHFNLGFHVRHTSLPRPGDAYLLKRLSGRVMSQQLDRGKPLWEIWIVEGLENGQFAIVNKTHHCMADGIAGADLLSALLAPTATETIEAAPSWVPRPAPSRTELIRDDLRRRIEAPFGLVEPVRQLAREPYRTASRWGESLNGLWQTLGAGLRRAPQTPLNRPIGPHRRFDWLTIDLADVKEVKNYLGGTVNDVVLATVAGGLRRFLKRRDPNVDLADLRALVPVSMRGTDQCGTLGNHVSAWLMPLPVREWDARRRFLKVREITTKLKSSKQVAGAAILTSAGTTLLTLGMRVLDQLRPFNLVVTNVPGPATPLYLLGARLREVYPQVPLFPNQGLGVALFSYAGKLCWGFNADCHVVPDLPDFVAAIQASFDELHEAALGSSHRKMKPVTLSPQSLGQAAATDG